jgi:hypothetical protein
VVVAAEPATADATSASNHVDPETTAAESDEVPQLDAIGGGGAVAEGAAAVPTEKASGGAGAGVPSDGGPSADDLLDQWVEAKRAKDFDKADSLRETLRAMGVEPDHARPKTGPPPPRLEFDAATEDKLTRWVAAKRAKDFDEADRLRDALRTAGVDPEIVRPVGTRPRDSRGAQHRSRSPIPFHPPPPALHGGYAPALPRYDRLTEAKLELWVAAKRKKDFTTADKLRDELRKIGVDPDTARPATAPQPQYHRRSPPVQPRYNHREREPYRAPAYPPRGGGGSQWGGGGGGGGGGWGAPPPLDPPPRHFGHHNGGGGGGYGGGGYGASSASPYRGGYGGGAPAYDSYGGGGGGGGGPYGAPAPYSDPYVSDPYVDGDPYAGGDPYAPVLPPPYAAARPPQAQAHYGMSTDEKLSAWVAAKRARDFATADAIRAELRAIGVNPDTARPAHPSGGGR